MADGATFYICRHGQTEHNRARRLQGWIDSPLTEDGLKPTQNVIEKLRYIKLDAMYSSDLGRAFITAYTIARGMKWPDEIVRLRGLREVGYGEANNMKKELAYKMYPGLDSDTHFAPPGGESLQQMQARVVETLGELNGKHAGQTVLIVAHEGVMAALHCAHTGQDLGNHHISQGYAHDFLATFTIGAGSVSAFREV